MNNKKEVIIDIYCGDKYLATEKRISHDMGCCTTIQKKLLNPETGKWVKYSTFAKASDLSDEELYLVKTWYYSSLSKPLFGYYDRLKAILCTRKNDNYAVILSQWDEHLARIEINSHTIFDVNIRDEHGLVVEGVCGISSVEDKIDYAIDVLEKIVNELKRKRDGEISKESEIYKATLNEDCFEDGDRPYCVEIYLADENGDYVQNVDYEYYSTIEEAEKRIEEINKGGCIED